MCHHYDYESTSWWDERADEDDWTPEGFEEERDVEVELITDGGDE